MIIKEIDCSHLVSSPKLENPIFFIREDALNLIEQKSFEIGTTQLFIFDKSLIADANLVYQGDKKLIQVEMKRRGSGWSFTQLLDWKPLTGI
jgi:hypothetical protein